jgi:bile acid:Na+ symporter, BASS family
MKSILDVGVISLTVLAMLLVGLELEFRRFQQLAKHVGALAVVLLMQIVLLPAVGLLVSYELDLSPTLRSGILLVAACPVGDMANFFTLIGRGNLAVSVSINAISCLISPLSMMVIFIGYGRILGTPFVFAAPGWGLVLRFLLLITIPMVAGVGVRFAWAHKMDRISRSLRLVCLLGVCALCVYVMVSRFDELKANWKLTMGASALLAVTAMMIGWMASSALTMERANKIALLISFAVRNVGLAATIAITMMNRIEYAVFSTVYFLSEVVLVLGAVVALRLWDTKAYAGNLKMGGARSR